MIRFFVLMVALFLVGCGSPSSEVVSGGQMPEKASPVGPFTIAFDANGNYGHSFDVPISQSEGKVEYKLVQSQYTRFQVASTSANVIGCDSSATNVSLLWRPDDRYDGVELATRGSIHSLDRDRTGSLIVVFGNLGGCQRLRFTVGLKKFL